MIHKVSIFCIAIGLCFSQCGQPVETTDGINTSLGNLHELTNAKSRSISPENFSGEKGKGGMAQLADSSLRHAAAAAKAASELGQGWKVNPLVILAPGETFTIAEIDGPGAIQHIWMTPGNSWRRAILRIYSDNEETPSVECPVGDFFCMGLDEPALVNSLPVVVVPRSGFNSYWTMPFRKHCKMTIENKNDEDFYLYYQIDYILSKVTKNAGYFHAQYREEKGAPTSIYTVLDGVSGRGQFVGMYMTCSPGSSGWWGEGEVKFYLDGDKDFPTINGTGLEDYFLGSYGWYETWGTSATYSTNYVGVPQIVDSKQEDKQPYYGMYRWHIKDPVYFSEDLRITVQDLGWKETPDGLRYLKQNSDFTSVAFWYQAEPHGAFPELPAQPVVAK